MLGDTGFTEFTTISLSTTPPQSSERRTDQRYMSVLQAGKIITDTFQELCLIRNISSSGVMADIFAPLEIDSPVRIELKVGATVRGTVRWIDESRVGIEFDEIVDIHALLAPHSGRMAPRAPRLSIDSKAQITIGELQERLQVIDISQGGMKVEVAPFLEPGLDIVVEIEGLPVRASVVRWVNQQYSGISFNRVMPLDQVAFWAAQQSVEDADVSSTDKRQAIGE